MGPGVDVGHRQRTLEGCLRWPCQELVTDRLGFSEEGGIRDLPIFGWVDVGWGTKELLAEGGRFNLCVM